MKAVRRHGLREKLGDVSIATVDRTVRLPGFPKPMLIGAGEKRRIQVWDADEVEAWLRAQRAEGPAA